MAVERHPSREEVLTGGADGEPKLYQIFRTKTRVIGDDFNRIRGYAALPGRIFSLQFNKDGSRFVVGASTATGGTARIYNTETGALLHELARHRRPDLCRRLPARRKAGRRRRLRRKSPPVRRGSGKVGERVPSG